MLSVVSFVSVLWADVFVGEVSVVFIDVVFVDVVFVDVVFVVFVDEVSVVFVVFVVFVDVVFVDVVFVVFVDVVFVDVVFVVLLTTCVSEDFSTESLLGTVSLSERMLTVTPPVAAAATRNTARTAERTARLRIGFTLRVIRVRDRTPVLAFRRHRLSVAVGSPRDVVRRLGSGFYVGIP